MLLPIDLLVLLKICALRERPWNQKQLAADLFISQSSVSDALKHAERSRLYNSSNRRVNLLALEEALVHGAKYFLTRGVPTGWAAPPLMNLLAVSNEPPPVWPDADGEVRGLAFEPLYSSAPRAARKDPDLYELLVLVDTLREGRARESGVAKEELRRIFHRE